MYLLSCSKLFQPWSDEEGRMVLSFPLTRSNDLLLREYLVIPAQREAWHYTMELGQGSEPGGTMMDERIHE